MNTIITNKDIYEYIQFMHLEEQIDKHLEVKIVPTGKFETVNEDGKTMYINHYIRSVKYKNVVVSKKEETWKQTTIVKKTGNEKYDEYKLNWAIHNDDLMRAIRVDYNITDQHMYYFITKRNEIKNILSEIAKVEFDIDGLNDIVENNSFGDSEELNKIIETRKAFLNKKNKELDNIREEIKK